MQSPSAILAINSLDRYTTTLIPTANNFHATWNNGDNFIAYDFQDGDAVPVVGAIVSAANDGIPFGTTIVSIVGNRINISQNTVAAGLTVLVVQFYDKAGPPQTNSLAAQYNNLQPYSNNFRIESPGALIYGYINKIIVSQVQLQYNIPTVNQGLNDLFYIYDFTLDELYFYKIPHGFYYADELAAVLQVLIRQDIPDMTVVFILRDGFVFNSPTVVFNFPDTDTIQAYEGILPLGTINNIYKTYRLLGMTIENTHNPPVGMPNTQTSSDYPNFLYTPYIDIYSDILTNYQNVKDTNTSVEKPKGLVARIYLSGTGQNQTTTSTSALGTAPFVMTADLNSPKVIRWSPDVAVPSLDFQLLDQYGDLIPGGESGYSSEFQMTLLCIEGRD